MSAGVQVFTRLGIAVSRRAMCTVPVADVTARHKLRSATRGLLNIPRYNMENYGRRAFSYASTYAWNSLPGHLRQTTSIGRFKRSLKTFLFEQIYRVLLSDFYVLPSMVNKTIKMCTLETFCLMG